MKLRQHYALTSGITFLILAVGIPLMIVFTDVVTMPTWEWYNSFMAANGWGKYSDFVAHILLGIPLGILFNVLPTLRKGKK